MKRRDRIAHLQAWSMGLLRSLLFLVCLLIGFFFLVLPFTSLWPRQDSRWQAMDLWLPLTGAIILVGTVRAFVGGGRDRPA